MAQYHRAQADNTAGKYGDALVRLGVAEAAAKEANKAATSFAPYLLTTLSPTLPADAGSAMLELTKAQLALCTEKKAEAQKDNDLIYNAVLPSEATLPTIDKLAIANAVPIQEVYGAPDVQKTIGPDLFIKLVPLSVHESASVYSEEKAKMVRGEVEKAEIAATELRSALDAVKQGLGRYRDMAESVGAVAQDPVPAEVKAWREEIALAESKEPVPAALAHLERLKVAVIKDVESAGRDLDSEFMECEGGRVKYGHLWTQEPSAGLAKEFRADLKSHRAALDAASGSDTQVLALWESVRGEVAVITGPQLEEMFANPSGSAAGSLLDMDSGADDQERQEKIKIGLAVDEIEDKMGKLNKIARERNEVLKDLKEKVRVSFSHLWEFH